MSNPFWTQKEIQQDLFGADASIYKYIYGSKINVFIGQFFEVVGCKLMQVKLTTESKVWKTYPDIIKWNYRKHDVLVEVKATCRNPLLSIKQLDDYVKLKLTDFPFTKPEIYYMFFYYDIKKVRNSFNRICDLLEALSQNVVTCIVLPLQIVINITSKLTPMTPSWGALYVRWRKSISELLKIGTEQSFKDAMQLTYKLYKGDIILLNGYTIKKRIVKNLKVNDYSIIDFPIVIVSNKQDGLLGIKFKGGLHV